MTERRGRGWTSTLSRADRGEQPDLCGSDDGACPNGHVARLDVVACTANVIARTHRLEDPNASATTVGVFEREHGVGQRGQRRARVDSNGLTRLQPDRLA